MPFNQRYYNGLVFQVVLEKSIVTQTSDTIIAGGRYDELLQRIPSTHGKTSLPGAVGFRWRDSRFTPTKTNAPTSTQRRALAIRLAVLRSTNWR